MTGSAFLSERSDSTSLILAMDIGGTKTAAALITPLGEILESDIRPTPQNGPEKGLKAIISQLEKLIDQSNIEKSRLTGIGIGIPAVLEPETDLIIWGPNLKGWKNVNLRKALEEYFHLPVCIEYDGHAAVLGEWWIGAGRGVQSLVSVIIGTGVGGGMVMDGRLIRGVNRLAGAVGWFTFGEDNRQADVESRSLGGWEAAIAGPGIARRARRMWELASLEERSKSGITENSSAQEVFSLAMQQDPMALRLAEEEARLIGLGLANIVSMLNPELIILGGSVGSNSGFLLPIITEVVKQNAQPISGQSVSIVSSKLGTNAGLLGAGWSVLLRKNKPTNF